MESPGYGDIVSDTFPTDILRAEHGLISRVLDAVDQVLESGPFDATPLRLFIEFASTFVDRCHHMREENLLFPRLERAGIPRQGGCMSRLLQDHQDARSLVRTMETHLPVAAAGDAAAMADVRKAATQYVTLLRSHMKKEESIVFPLAERTLSEDEKRVLVTEMNRAARQDDASASRSPHLLVAEKLFESAYHPRRDTIDHG